ncbi:MAG TPA: fatty acid desaturase [Steroidobacteraceae bacterium]|jgi:stearoyl-CoA desaturase (delta-9 desaturase)
MATMATMTALRRTGTALARWLDSSAGSPLEDDDQRVDWLRTLPFIALHLSCLAVIWVGVSKVALMAALALYAIRMFAITGFYHRYFSHRAFRASRTVQFVFAAIGASGVQRGPLWWAAHHRNHHRHADEELDPHSPSRRGFFWSHVGWFLTPHGFRTDWSVIRDLARYPELRLLDRFDILMPVLLATTLFVLGQHLSASRPQLGTDGLQLVVWGFCISTVVLFHATFTINSLAHRFGSRRFGTRDNSRNNWLLALITFGEGWHNNHHRFPGAARQGLRWWEYDLTYYGLSLLSWLGLVHDLRPYPASLRGRTP